MGVGAGVGGVLWVNLAYPEWTGGWTTGPRLLVPLLPFAAVGVAGFLAGGAGRGAHGRIGVTAVLAFSGFVVVQLLLGVGGRIPETYPHPLAVAWPLWTGGGAPAGWIGGRFCSNLTTIVWPGLADDRRTPPAWQWTQFVPLWVFQAVGLALLLRLARRIRTLTPPSTTMTTV